MVMPESGRATTTAVVERIAEEMREREREREREKAEMYIRFNEPRQRECGADSPPSPAKFHPREQSNKFILAVVAGEREGEGNPECGLGLDITREAVRKRAKNTVSFS